jgi:hypothetical protein
MDAQKQPAVKDSKAKTYISSAEPGDEKDNAKHDAARGVASEQTPSADEETSSSKHSAGVKKSHKRKYVEKGSLTEATLIEEKIRARSTKNNKHETTEEDKMEERRAANRLSAFQSRQRRLDIIEDLQV